MDNFFASDNGQNEKHTLEESIYRPLIGKRNSKPFFMFCSIYPKVEFLHLERMENHIKLYDPKEHKAKLLEYLEKQERTEG